MPAKGSSRRSAPPWRARQATLQDSLRGEFDEYHTEEQLAVGTDPTALVYDQPDADSLSLNTIGS